MSNEDPTSGDLLRRSLGVVKRRVVTGSGESPVRYGELHPGGLPLLVEPASPGIDLASWAAANRSDLEAKLLHHGGILFRGFDLRGPEDLEKVIVAVSGEPLQYQERSSPRTSVRGNIYTSTDYPASQPIFLHNENSYQSVWPLKIFFLCQQAAEEGGETPIADCRRVFARLDPEVRERFLARGWMYVRNFGEGFGLDWRTVFQTEDPAAVEEYCRHKGIEVQWKSEGRLRTSAVRSAVVRHPRSGELLWFNHATFFHVSTLDPQIRDALLEEFEESDLPATTFYGDGSPIEPATLDHLRSLYAEETITFPWKQGDLLMLDNMMVAHGRSPYRGPRRILVGMSEAVERDSAA